MTTESEPGVDLYWLPFGAGGHSVRLNGRIFEAVAARLEGRARCKLYHSALEVRVPEGPFVIEQTPIPDSNGGERGVVAEGGRKPLGAAFPALPVRGAPLARWRYSRRKPSSRKPTATKGRSTSVATSA